VTIHAAPDATNLIQTRYATNMKLKVLFFGIILFTQFQVYSQDGRLFGNTWYLTSIELNGQTYFPPSNAEVPFVTLDFIESNGFETKVCDILSGTLDFNSGPFTFVSHELTTLGCTDQENITFQSQYLENFYVANINNSFSYGIIKDPGSYELIIFLPNGSQALYSSELLSNSDLSLANLNVYPNPTEKYIYLPNNWAQLEIDLIFIYDSSGNIIFELNDIFNTNMIDVSEFSNGLYFLKVINRKGNVRLVKFIKI
jgi:hypothetical protein